MSSRTEQDWSGWRPPSDVTDDVLAERPALVRHRSPDEATVEGPTVALPALPGPEAWGHLTLVSALAPVYGVGGEPRAVYIVGGPPAAAQALTKAAHTLGLEVATGTSMAESGLSATASGQVHPDDVMSEAHAAPGNVVVVTRNVGEATSLDTDGWRALTAADAATMRAARRVGVRSATVIGGHGVLGAVHSLMRGSRVSATIEAALLPLGVHRSATPTAEQAACLDLYRRVTTFTDTEPHLRHAMATPSSAGGLLLSVDAPLAAAFLQALADEGITGTVVGRVTARSFSEGPSGRLTVQ